MSAAEDIVIDGTKQNDTDTYECPLIQVKYMGSCPVTDCPANVAKENRKSGCCFNYLNGKREVGQQDLAYVFGITMKETKQRIEAGKASIQLVLLLNDVLTRLRDNNKKARNCPKCGIFRTSKGPCLNKIECEGREIFVFSLLQRSPFNIPELEFTAADVFLLITNRKKINEFLVTLDNDNRRIRFSTILGLSKDELATAREMKTLV